MPEGYFRAAGVGFNLFTAPGAPAWRAPQLGAALAAGAHWSLRDPAPALVSLPTGTGKTAVALAAPFLVSARRCLVIVPSLELRRQTVEAFSTQGILVRIGALSGDTRPAVVEVSKRVTSWRDLLAADVVVALPNSISPAHYGANQPPADLFDLVVIDEAHHAPAPTWRAVLDGFRSAKALLLTATPYRRDGQRLPGRSVYNYPLRQALEDGIYKPITALILPPISVTERLPLDTQIRDAVVRLLERPEHRTSTVLIRASRRDRAEELAASYRASGLAVQVLHSGVGPNTQANIIGNLRSGALRAVAVVGMLGEGFDLPSFRILAYHDKHKSLPATAQLVGRLARADAIYPQPSVVVTVRDVDVYPDLQGAVRGLYDEDPDWATVLPGIIDDEIANAAANRSYVHDFASAPPSLSLEAVQPIKRSIIRELPREALPPSFASGRMPDELTEGHVVRGSTIFYTAIDIVGKTLLVVSSAVLRPKWHDDPGLDSVAYALHLLSIRQPPRADLPALLFINTDDNYLIREILRILDLDRYLRNPDPGRLQEAFDSIERVSVSSVGVRTTYAGRGTPSYRMFVGSGVDRGIRDADTAFASLGHAMVQASDEDGGFTAGIATGKGKWWETRYAYLREYMQFISDLAERYWFPPASPTGQLLPQVTRGTRLERWPDSEALAVEFDFALIGTGWHTDEGIPLERLDIRPSGLATDGRRLPLEIHAFDAQVSRVIWRGFQDLAGEIHTVGHDVTVQRGLGMLVQLGELLSERPPTIFFMNGVTVLGATQFDSRSRSRELPAELLRPERWDNVDLGAETRASATRRNQGRSVHEALEQHLAAMPRRNRHRWIISNDGPGELADYLVLETGDGRPHLSLWHAKFAHGQNPSVRIGDLEELVAQSIKSRRWITEVGFWAELGARLHGRAVPAATLVEGHARQLDVLCGEIDRWRAMSFPVVRPVVLGHIGLAQPGLSKSRLEAELNSPVPAQSALQAHELLNVLQDSVSTVASLTFLCSA